MGKFECKICGGECFVNSDFTRFLALGETDCRVLSCNTCKTAFLSGDIPENIYYDEYFTVLGGEYDYERQSLSNKHHYQDIIMRLMQYGKKTQHLADIGCGMGHFVREASEHFNVAEGFDGFANPERFVGRPEQLLIEDIDKLVLSEQRYDAITLNHSLEHVDDPVRLLRQVFQGLRAGGVLYVEVPFQFGSYYDKISAIINRKKSPDFLSFHHRTFFCPKSLRILLQKTGFEVLDIRTFLPLRGAGRFGGFRGKLLYVFLWLSSLFSKADYIAVFAKKNL